MAGLLGIFHFYHTRNGGLNVVGDNFIFALFFCLIHWHNSSIPLISVLCCYSEGPNIQLSGDMEENVLDGIPKTSMRSHILKQQNL